jgi:CRP-like cAMP-binding protein
LQLRLEHITANDMLRSSAPARFAWLLAQADAAMVHVALVTTLLGNTDLFGSLDEHDRAVVAKKMREAQYAADEIIFTRGDPPNGLHLVVEGRVRLSVLSSDGGILSFNHASVGTIFGEVAMLDGGARTADATALTSVRTMVLDRDQFLQIVEAKPIVGRAAIDFVCARLRATSHQVETIALHPAEVRLARFLLAAIRLAKTPIAPSGLAILDLGTSQTEIALLLGVSRQKVNGAIADLEARGALTRDGRRRIICNVRELESIAASS